MITIIICHIIITLNFTLTSYVELSLFCACLFICLAVQVHLIKSSNESANGRIADWGDAHLHVPLAQLYPKTESWKSTNQFTANSDTL